MFDAIPTYARYRTLKLGLEGEDVFALQTGLTVAAFTIPHHDGVFGPTTLDAVKRAQARFGLLVDGLAGGQTQRALALRAGQIAREKYSLALGAIHGQMEHESGFRLGNYSPPRPDGSFDAGVCQMNSAHTSPAVAFDVGYATQELGRRMREYYDLFNGLPKRRRWALAQGAWNAPAYACFLAREEGARDVPANLTARPSASARETLEAYIAAVTLYLKV